MTRSIFIAAALALAVTLPAIPAQALVARTFVSAAGSDSNNCANVATPCRHLANAFAATAADGEIYVLDPANYGSVTITHGVSIEGHGWASIAPVAHQAAITINAGPSDKINIIGVVLDGTATLDSIGIKFDSGGSLTVRDSVIRNFTLQGLLFQPNGASKISVWDTLVSDNNQGIYIGPLGSGTTSGVLDHVHVENSLGDGITLTTSTQTLQITLTDSVSANNGGTGVIVDGSNTGGTFVWVRNSNVSYNTQFGVQVTGPSAATVLTRSTITGNNTGGVNQEGGVINGIASYTDNTIVSNGNDAVSPLTLTYR